MPGRREPLESVWAAGRREGINAIVRLAELPEVGAKSPRYGEALKAGDVPFPILVSEIPDYGVPKDRDAFWSRAQEVASRVRAGEVILVHCGAGVGRTGTFAICVLVALGQSVTAAKSSVSGAGSAPETVEQRELIEWCVSQRTVQT